VAVCCQIEFLRPITVSILSERRSTRPFGLLGGDCALPGLNLLLRADGRKVNLGAKNTANLVGGERIRILTPGEPLLSVVSFSLKPVFLHRNPCADDQEGVMGV
jgi:N-methylhydantoinase B/oxoprolinase/acetone carboxylase alpha subunit